ncbi:putative reverse transcriptase domain-containing protein [Tanacetum coccineum]
MTALVIPIFIPVIHVVPTEVPIVPVDPLVALEVGVVSVILPTKVLDFYGLFASSDSDPSEDSLPLAPELPLVSPFLCSDDSEADSKFEPAEQRPERHDSLTDHDVMVLRLAWRRVSHHSLDHHSSPDFTSDSSSSGLSSDSSSDTSSGSYSASLLDSSSVHLSGCDTSGQIHLGPSTRVSSPRSAPLSTPYPSKTLESSLNSYFDRSLDSSSRSAGPSHKRCRSPTTLVPSSTHVLRLIATTLADILPPNKRFRDSYSPEDSREEHMEIGTADVEAVADLGIGDGVGAPIEDGTKANAGGTMEITIDPLVTCGISESIGGDVPDLEGTLYDIAHYMSEVPLGRITEFETAQRQLESGYLRRHMALSQEEFRQIRRDHDDTQRRLRRLESLVERRLGFHQTREANGNIKLGNGNDEGGNGNGNGNRNGGGNGNGNHNENDRECTYQDFMKCQPLNFKGTKGVLGLIRWFEKMETIFHISNCPEKYQVKYATCTLLNSALTWWNSHKRTIGTDAEFVMSWREIIKLMVEVYCPRTEIQKMESELWNLTVKNNDLATYTQRFQELTMLYTKMVPEEED